MEAYGSVEGNARISPGNRGCTYIKESSVRIIAKSILNIQQVEGIFRLWFVANGKERTIGFGYAGDPFTSISTYWTNKPSLFSFEALSDGEIYYIPHSDIKRLIDTNKEFSDWMLAYLFEQLNALYRKEVIFGAYNALKRFEAFVLNRPDVYKSVSAKYLAQYLNIAPETLSRIQSAFIKMN